MSRRPRTSPRSPTSIPRRCPPTSATIGWPGGGTTAGIITEDASDVFHVTGTHTFGTSGNGQGIAVTIKDSNGTLYQTGDFNQTNIVSSVAGTRP